MTIQYMSDLHLEFTENRLFMQRLHPKVTGDILLIAGDSFYLGDDDIIKSDFLKWAADNYEQVLMIPGNHEYYGGCDIKQMGTEWEWKLMSNVCYYYNKVVTIGDTDFILSTLWSHITPQHKKSVGYFLTDFHRIKYHGRKFTTDDYNAEHELCLDFIRKSINSSKAAHRVVVTHHLPTHHCTPHKLKVIRDGTLVDAFTIDLTDYIKSVPIDYWIYGHSHLNFGVNLGGTLVTSNQLGYVFHRDYEWNGFDFSKSLIL